MHNDCNHIFCLYNKSKNVWNKYGNLFKKKITLVFKPGLNSLLIYLFCGFKQGNFYCIHSVNF